MEGQKQKIFNVMEPEARRRYLDPSNPSSPYFGYIGNRRAVDKLIRIDFEALGSRNHLCSHLSFAFIGSPGVGKTDLARRHARANKLPLVEISPTSVKKCHDVFKAIKKVCEQEDVPLVQMVRANHYVIPPINLFADEIHAYPKAVIEGLLKAIEHNDRVLHTENGVTVDCRFIHWMTATTERGKLPEPFDTRFSKVILNLYTKQEIAQIVQVNNPDWEWQICNLVAKYCGRIPREALAFSREMRLEYNMNPQLPWHTIAKKVAEDNEIDEFGLSYKRLAILKALGDGPIAEKRLPVIAGVQLKELEKFILPWLMTETEDQPALITVGHSGYCLTQAGVEELKKRGIRYAA